MKTDNQKAREAMGLCWHEFVKIKSSGTFHEWVCRKCSEETEHEPDYRVNNDRLNLFYDEEIRHAWKIVEWMTRKQWGVDVNNKKYDGSAGYTCEVSTENCCRILDADTAPKAIVAAFLKAMESLRCDEEKPCCQDLPADEHSPECDADERGDVEYTACRERED